MLSFCTAWFMKWICGLYIKMNMILNYLLENFKLSPYGINATYNL